MQSGGGIAINIGSHSVDKLLWLTDSRVTKVKASLTYFGARGDVEGSANLLMQTESGITANVALSGYHNVMINEMDLLFTDGQLKLEGSHKLWIGDKMRKSLEPVELEGEPGAFHAQWDDLLNAIERGCEPGISGAYGQSIAEVVAAIYRSHESGTEQEVQGAGALRL